MCEGVGEYMYMYVDFGVCHVYLASSPGPPSFQCYTQKKAGVPGIRSRVTYVIGWSKGEN